MVPPDSTSENHGSIRELGLLSGSFVIICEAGASSLIVAAFWTWVHEFAEKEDSSEEETPEF